MECGFEKLFMRHSPQSEAEKRMWNEMNVHYHALKERFATQRREVAATNKTNENLRSILAIYRELLEGMTGRNSALESSNTQLKRELLHSQELLCDMQMQNHDLQMASSSLETELCAHQEKLVAAKSRLRDMEHDNEEQRQELQQSRGAIVGLQAAIVDLNRRVRALHEQLETAQVALSSTANTSTLTSLSLSRHIADSDADASVHSPGVQLVGGNIRCTDLISAKRTVCLISQVEPVDRVRGRGPGTKLRAWLKRLVRGDENAPRFDARNDSCVRTTNFVIDFSDDITKREIPSQLKQLRKDLKPRQGLCT